jgi:FkbM family methyltransferase
MGEFNDQRISVHHVGGRAGSRAFPVLKAFEKDIINVLYDADPDCLAHVRQMNQHLESQLHVLPYCLDDSRKSASLNINYDPYTSSLYPPNPDYDAYYSFNKSHDYIMSDGTKVMEKRAVDAVNMDSIFHSKDVSAPAPDFLSIDTQGSEYDILLGAKETLESNVVALALEAEFHPIYKGQKLFGDLVKLLSERGFDFVRFLGIYEMSPFRAPIGLRGEGFHIFSDALFLRRVEKIGAGRHVDQMKSYLMLRKLAFISIVFKQFEYGWECLRRSRNLAVSGEAIHEEAVYLKFLRDFDRQAEKVPRVYPVTFASKYPSFAASQARFEVQKEAALGVAGIKRLLTRHMPLLYGLLRWMKRVYQGFFLKGVFLLRLMLGRYTDVEKILMKYGLRDQANLLKKNRFIQTPFADTAA